MTEIQSVNYVDLILLACMLLSLIVGVVRGFTQEVLGIIGWVGAVFVAIYTLPFTRPIARDMISSPLVADVAAGALVFLLTLILLTFLCRGISGRIKESALGGIDRSLGLLFGIARGYVILSLVYLMAASLTKIETWPENVQSAKALPFLDQGADYIKSLLPKDFRPQNADKLKQDLRSSEEIMKNLSRLNPMQEKKETETTYDDQQKEKMDKLFKK